MSNLSKKIDTLNTLPGSKKIGQAGLFLVTQNFKVSDKGASSWLIFTQYQKFTSKITGIICGYRVEEIEDKLMQQARYLDKLIDELAKGKAMEKSLRT